MGLALVGGCAVAPKAGPDVEAFVKMRWPVNADLGPLPERTLYFVYNPDGINQLYRVPRDTSQDKAVKITSFKDGISGYRLSDDGRWIVVSAAAGGNEQDNLYLYQTSTGLLEPLLINPKVVYGSVVWRRDSLAFAYRANDENPADFHVYLYDLATRASKKVYAGSGHHEPVDFSGDGGRLVIMKVNSASYTQLLEVTLASGETREITPKGEEWSYEPIGYTVGDQSFWVNTDYGGDLKRLHSIDLKTGEMSPLLAEFAKGREIDGGGFNEDRSTLAVIVNEDGYATLHFFRAFTLAPVRGPDLPKGLVGNLRFTGTMMLFSVENANTPGVIYQWDLARPDTPPVALTSADTQGIDVSRFRLPELVHYPSFDGTQIPAFLYLPESYRRGQKIPFIVQYHGGPESQYRPSFNRAFQYFLSRGYGILAPNVRGSSGYGKAFIDADNYQNREKSVKDGIYAVKYLINEGYASPKRVAAWGGSYGGFMVMATVTEAPELFGAACNIVGIVNFQTFLEQTKDYRRKLREAEYGPLSDPEFLQSISPIHKIDRIQAPLMIAHGLNDPRVPVGEAMQIAVALKRRGLPVEELYFPDEGHGFAKEENRLLYMKQLAAFFDRYLR
ncbi:MAG: S9 family peptidase [Planctomycetes bacterium]|nr:S9 family peptidase [Planctomycetota bacterium]